MYSEKVSVTYIKMNHKIKLKIDLKECYINGLVDFGLERKAIVCY